jgi:hypothetical protein
MKGAKQIGLGIAATIAALAVGAALFIASGAYDIGAARHQDERDAGVGQEPERCGDLGHGGVRTPDADHVARGVPGTLEPLEVIRPQTRFGRDATRIRTLQD